MQTPLVVLGVLDGFGFSAQVHGNAIATTPTPTLDRLWSHYPHWLLKAAEEEVGLAFGEVGNSEVGHIAIGTGRVVPQNLSTINAAIDDESFYANPKLLHTLQYVKEHKTSLHVLGIISTAGVHGHLYHLLSVVKAAKTHQIPRIALHLILDGRDAGPKDTPFFLREIEKELASIPQASIVSIIGRAYAMDRNHNWDKTKLAYDLLTGKPQERFSSVTEALEHYYNQGLDDEQIPGTSIGNPITALSNRDALIFTNFREDRARQITRSLCLPGFYDFERPNHPEGLLITTMTSYEKALPVEVLFPPPEIYNTFADVLSKHQIPQIHIAESEKYAHVTYFFNGGREAKAPLEEYYLVPSLKPEDFESRPEMSAEAIAEAVITSIDLGYKVVVFNLANCDMVGHTGNFAATQQAVACVDTLLTSITDATFTRDGYFFLTADHGNSEIMIDIKTNGPLKEHTISPVPFIAAHSQWEKQSEIIKVLEQTPVTGLLSDVAPTILSVMGLPVPMEMTGTSLI